MCCKLKYCALIMDQYQPLKSKFCRPYSRSAVLVGENIRWQLINIWFIEHSRWWDLENNTGRCCKKQTLNRKAAYSAKVAIYLFSNRHPEVNNLTLQRSLIGFCLLYWWLGLGLSATECFIVHFLWMNIQHSTILNFFFLKDTADGSNNVYKIHYDDKK